MTRTKMFSGRPKIPWLVFVVALHFLSCNKTPTADRPPNILLIVIDDLGYGDLGCYGSTIHQTPHIDRLAAEGLLLTDFHTNGCVCSPTRAALLTGQYQQRSGVEGAIGFTKEKGMPLAKTTIAELFSQVGYRNGVFGKWHVGHVSRFGPNDQGFHESFVSNNTPDYHTHISRTGELDWYKNQELLEEHGYLTNLVTKHANRFIEENRGGPFFVFMSHLACHFPFQGPQDPPHRTPGKTWHETKYGPLSGEEYKRAYRDMLQAADKSVGETVALLDRLGLRDKTLIFLTSDNGAYSWVGHNGPYRGQKGDLYEGGHRVPAIVHWPGHIEQGKVLGQTVMTMDLMPTLLRLANIQKPEALHLDGVDLTSVFMQNRQIPHRMLFWRFNNPSSDIKTFAVRDGNWKYIKNENGQYLFDLGKDPGEKRNLAGEMPEKVARYRKDFRSWELNVTGGSKNDE